MDYDKNGGNGKTIIQGASEIECVTNKGIYYTLSSDNCVYFIGYGESEGIRIVQSGCEIKYSSNNDSVVAITKLNEIVKFTVGEERTKKLCTVDENTELCCISNDGLRVVWGTEDSNSYTIYTLKEGIPERTGKINVTVGYALLTGSIFNSGSTCLISAYGGKQIILIQDGSIIQVDLPGSKSFGALINCYGDGIRSESSKISQLYFSVANNKNSTQSQICKLSIEYQIIVFTISIKIRI